MDLSIIIVSWNTRALTASCLTTLLADLNGIEAEVFVVDNASTDGSADFVATHFPTVHLIRNTENVGFSRANNQALPLCRGRWVILLNSDTETRPGAMRALLAAADADPKIGMVGPLLLNGDGTIQQSWSRYVGPAREFLGRHDRSEAPPSLRDAIVPPDAALEPFPVGWLGGACLMARREGIERVGPLDEGYFMYCEEMDWCRRFRQAGWDIRLVPEARVVHLGGQSSRQVSQATRERLAASKIRYYQLHGQPWDVVTARALGALFLRRGQKAAEAASKP